MVLAATLGVLSNVRADDSSAATNAPSTDAASTNAATTNAPSATAAGPDSAPASTNAPSWVFHPLVFGTNSDMLTFPDNHPELTAPSASERPALSLHSDSSTNAPDVIAPPSNLFSDTFQEAHMNDWGDDLASHLLVVYNSNDSDSKDLAYYYAGKRNIPNERVLAISCPITEEINRKDYDDTIRTPILTYLSVKGWISRKPERVKIGERTLDLLVATRNDIWAIVLIRGVPLKISSDPFDYFGMEAKPELQTNAAAVDSELALLPVFGLPLGGYVPNIFFESQPGGVKQIGPDLACSMILVTRLDGPTVADVRRMIDDTLYAEKHRLAGLAVVDSRGMTDERDGYTSGDIWLRGARDALVKNGWMVKFDDRPELIPATDPLNQVAIYLGWYSQDAMGPWVTPPDRFVPGAIAYHLHSFSAYSVRSETGNWVGPLIAHGADATMGMVYEPYLALTPHEDIFARRLLAGDYFAVAAYASERGLSWMLTVVGDPLYRPFFTPLDSAVADVSNPHTPHDDWLLLQRVQLQLDSQEIASTPESMKQAIDISGAGPVALEGLADMLEKINDPAADTFIERAYQKAAYAESAPIDRIRLGLKLAQYYRTHNDEAQAQAELDNVRELFPNDAARFGVVDTLVPTSAPPTRLPVNAITPPGPAQLPQLPQLPKPTPVAP